MKSIKYNNISLIGENIPDNYVVGEDNNAYRVLPDHNIVPVSHPDLSTQPSILPYRFGATPVYEVLIANGRENEIPSDAIVIEAFSFNKDVCVPAVVEKRDEGWSIHNSESIVPDFTLIKYIGKTDDYYYYNIKKRYNHFIYKDSIIAKLLPYTFIEDVFNEPLSRLGQMYYDGSYLHAGNFNMNGYPTWFDFYVIPRYFSGDSKDNMLEYSTDISYYTMSGEYTFNLHPSHQFHTLYLQLVARYYKDGEVYVIVPLYFDNLNDNSNLQILKIDIDFAKSGMDQISYELVDYTTLNDIFKD